MVTENTVTVTQRKSFSNKVQQIRLPQTVVDVLDYIHKNKSIKKADFFRKVINAGLKYTATTTTDAELKQVIDEHLKTLI